MKIRKRVLAALDNVYVVTAVEIDGDTGFLAATEGRGPCLLFRPPAWEAETVWQGPGGAMSLVPLQTRPSGLLAIQGFFPIFQAAAAGVVHALPPAAAGVEWAVRRVLELPFVHRIEAVYPGGLPHLVAATLCAGKDDVDDWSQPGAVYLVPVSWSLAAVWPRPRPLLTGIVKNHGMCVSRLDGTDVVLVSASEGVFRINVPDSAAGAWECSRLLEHEVSDMSIADIDGDGVAELVTIEPFHGDCLTVYRRHSVGGAWVRAASAALSFGHVVWAGSLGGAPALLGGSRAGDRDLVLFRVESGARQWRLRPQVLDTGGGPTQVAVVQASGVDLVCSANHGAGEVVLYELRH